MTDVPMRSSFTVPCALPPQPGFVATRPGASLSVTFDSAATAALPEPQPGGGERAGGGAPPRRTAVTISHLRSYEHMGQAGE